MTASFAASILVDVTVIAAAALAGTWLAGKSRAAVRHVILCAAFAALLTLPFATLIAPPVRITVRVSAPAAALTAAEPFARVFSAETSTTTESSSASVPQSSIVAASTIVVTIWIAGAALLLLPLLAALWHTRSLRRSALPWRRGQSIRKGVFGGAGVGVPPDGIEKGPSIFTALEEQLGLKLERTRGPHDYIVIDRVQKSSPN